MYKRQVVVTVTVTVTVTDTFGSHLLSKTFDIFIYTRSSNHHAWFCITDCKIIYLFFHLLISYTVRGKLGLESVGALRQLTPGADRRSAPGDSGSYRRSALGDSGSYRRSAPVTPEATGAVRRRDPAHCASSFRSYRRSRL